MGLALAPIRAQLLPGENPSESTQLVHFAEAGLDLAGQPQLGAYLGLPRGWQAGLQVRSGVWVAVDGYDYLPQTGLHGRKLWTSDGEFESIRNSEYLDVGLGAFFAYDLASEKIGPRPFVSVAIGKYWTPFENLPAGLDLGLEITRYLSGVPPRRTAIDRITACLNTFYRFP